MGKKYYVVWKGKETGIFDNWEDCKSSIHGVKGAEYKSFKSRPLAEKAWNESYADYKGKKLIGSELSPEQRKLIGNPIQNSISVDAACSGNPGLMEYQGVHTATGEVIFRKGPYYHSTNNIGEFLAIVHALAHMKQTNDLRPIYTDSKTAMNWVREKYPLTTLERNQENEITFELLERAKTWLENNNFENKILKWETKAWGEIPADFGRK